MKHGVPLVLGCAMAFTSTAASAEESLIKSPGDHPSYVVDLEPHGAFAVGGGPFKTFGDRKDAYGFGPGLRATFNIVSNGFIPKLNNSVGIGVGADLVFVGAQYARLVVPVVLQWNFWVSTHWSVFGEPGVAFGFVDGPFGVAPHFAAGGRYNFNEHVALTIRLGYPVSTIGVSFLL
jgi:hypothetical protein